MYGPQWGKCDGKNSAFYDEFNAVVRAKDGKRFIMGDFSGHVGSSTDGCVGVHGGNKWGERKRNGKGFLNLLTVLI